LPDWSAALATDAFLAAPASSWLPAGRIDSRFTVTVRIVDDAADNDGNVRTDSNGVVIVHSLARGPAGERRALRGVMRRTRQADGTLPAVGGRLLSVQETR
jgi:hypothetical protein